MTLRANKENLSGKTVSALNGQGKWSEQVVKINLPMTLKLSTFSLSFCALKFYSGTINYSLETKRKIST